MSHSKLPDAPAKPHPDFPLFPHKCGQWAKKIKGHLKYFGSVKKDPAGESALADYHDFLAGRPRKADSISVVDLCDRFLVAKQAKVDSGELVPRTFTNYKQTTDFLVAHFGKFRAVETLTVEDFEQLRAKIAIGRGPASIGNIVQVTRLVFRYGYDSELFDKPVRFGQGFKRPSRKVMRVARAAKGSCMFEAAEIRALLETADVQMKAMILLAANCGFGNADCGQLPIAAVDLETAWVRFPRPKTGIDRRCPLWKETVEALRLAIAKRPLPKDTADLGKLFITKYGGSWFKTTGDNPVTKEFRKLLNELKLHRRGLGFYSLRRGFETIGGETGDQVAVDFIMGHAEDARDMASVYRQRISDERLKAVTDKVHAWLFPPKPKATRKPATRKGGAK